MLTLSLLRHAKSAWDQDTLSDFERPLADRGRDAAPKMGRAINAAGLKPSHIYCSGAVRTRQTLALVLPELAPPPPTVTYDDGLYLCPPLTMLDRIHKMPATDTHILFVGHNPCHHILAVELANAGDPEALRLAANKFPTCGLAVLTFKTNDWRDVTPGTGTLTHFITPRGLSKSA